MVEKPENVGYLFSFVSPKFSKGLFARVKKKTKVVWERVNLVGTIFLVDIVSAAVV